MSLIASVFCFHISFCAAMTLDGPEYGALPPIYQLDPHKECLYNSDGLYCDVNFALVSEDESPLLNIIQKYSSENMARYDHSNLDYGLCLTNCKNITGPNNDTKQYYVESCLNKTFWEQYQLKTKVKDKLYCGNDTLDIDGADVAVAVLFLTIILLNIAGSLFDFFGTINGDQEILSCFSIRRNWKGLFAPIDENVVPLKRLKTINGLRVISMVCVISVHSMLPVANFITNIQYIENFFNNYYLSIIFNGTIMMQSFFIFSGCLLAIKFCLDFEGRTPKLMTIPSFIYNRWLRLTIPYALVLAFTSTWMRHLGSGPLWQRYVVNEVKDCRIHWWLHLLYINNYFTNSECMGQTWYLATDMQLYCVCVFVFVLFKTLKSRKIALISFLVIGCVFRIWNTYYYNLDAFLVLTPEQSRFFFQKDKNFINMYVLGHTNLPASIIGLFLGYILYSYRDQGCDKFKKYRYVFWMIPLLLAGTIYTGLLFNVFKDSVYLKMVYSALSVIVYGVLVSLLIAGCTFKIENFYRSILEWDGWTVPSRLNYGAYILHVALIRYFAGTKHVLFRPTFLLMLMVIIGTITISFLGAIAFRVLFEAPLDQLIQVCGRTFTKRKVKAYDDNNTELH